ncbi:SIR2 family protein [Janibacter sp. Y6]|uniref:SIR2 family protein n=1 Tax=Janibacter sp. Y6 TaxID=2913552 RepID=UPI0034A28CAD
MIDVAAMAAAIEPSACSLFFGSGAGISSGAPTGAGLASALMDELAPGAEIDGGLDDVASILELRLGRPRLIAALRKILEPLMPGGGFEALPAFNWSAIYTTNYDYLIERSYARSRRALAVSRSNFDFSLVEKSPDATPLFKVHGCLSQDISDGHQARMVITEADYDDYSTYREVLFKRLDLDISSKDLIVIGHSLRDPHIKEYMDSAARLHREKNAPGRLFALLWEKDEERAALMERKGYQIAFGGLEDLLSNLLETSAPVLDATAEGDFVLPPALRPRTIEVQQARRVGSNVMRLFNGSAASYSDVEDGFTFPRDVEVSGRQSITDREALSLVITGTGGVGKTTLARRLLVSLADTGYLCWEHDNNFPFVKSDWLAVEAKLREAGLYGVLLIDDCPPLLSQINQLVGSLAELDYSALIVVLTAASPQWRPRTKNPVIFERGEEIVLSRLSDADIRELINLLDRKQSVKHLVAPIFSSATAVEKFSLLRRRCGADMYVCLKNVFATESLDSILLREFADLSIENQEMYRLVAALEATGGQVHRQLVLRLLGVESGTISAMLNFLEGVVDEFDIKPHDGLFGLSTRHRVIAQTITKYKYADEVERYSLLKRVIAGLNPTLFLELRMVREICDKDYGIGSLSSEEEQAELYRSLITLAPAERIPRHRLVGLYLRSGEFDLAERELQDAVEAVGLDPPLARYEVMLSIKRSQTTPGIMDEDRYALLLRAYAKAQAAIRRFEKDPYSRIVRADVALAVAELTKDTTRLDEAIADLELAYSELREPNLNSALRRMRDVRRTFG